MHYRLPRITARVVMSTTVGRELTFSKAQPKPPTTNTRARGRNWRTNRLMLSSNPALIVQVVAQYALELVDKLFVHHFEFVVILDRSNLQQQAF